MIPYYLLGQRIIGTPTAGGPYRYGNVNAVAQLAGETVLYVTWEGTRPGGTRPRQWRDTVMADAVVAASIPAAA